MASSVYVQITMPKDNLHWGEVEHRNLHNLNGALFHQATAEVFSVKLQMTAPSSMHAAFSTSLRPAWMEN